MMIKITLPGSIRSKKNSKQIVCVPTRTDEYGNQKETANKHHWARMGWKYCYNTIHPSKAYKKWEKEARIYALENLPLDVEVLTCPIKVKILAYYKGPRPDLSGAYESVGDCLEGIIWEDDKQIEAWDGDSRVIHDLKNPRTEVEVWEFETPKPEQDSFINK